MHILLFLWLLLLGDDCHNFIVDISDNDCEASVIINSPSDEVLFVHNWIEEDYRHVIVYHQKVVHIKKDSFALFQFELFPTSEIYFSDIQRERLCKFR